ncbi:MAG: cystathionine gamma-synthase family protein [Proteobacteria bacterium]|nr:cystathionine gamma-synthase family protein [Pseudomonadota bacterium]HOL37756.1 cystathionine gamma-synthase family protein [Rubrivivax sp.]
MSYSAYHKKSLLERELHPETQMMSYGYDPFLSEGSVKPPVFLTSTFAFRSAEDGAEFFDVVAGRKPQPQDAGAGLVYSRFNHPNLEIVEDRLALLDGAEAAAVTSSGMAAISMLFLTLLRPGEQIVYSTPLYGGTETLIRKILPEWGIGSEPFADGLAAAQMEAALEAAAARGKVSLLYLETPANPTNSLVDLQAVGQALAGFERRHGYRPVSACDNTMLGPIFQHPVREGIDLAVYSLTKYVGGHSDLVAGGVSGSAELVRRLKATRGAFGSQLDPHSSWMIARSMETLVLRMRRAAATASRVAHWLAENKVRRVQVLHPQLEGGPAYQAVYRRQCSGAGSTFSIVLDGGREAAFRFINALALFRSAVSLGGTESLVCHPASTTHSVVAPEVRAQFGISDGLVRLSIGLEHEEDLIADLENALRAC